MARRLPFDSERPDVQAGQLIQCRTAFDGWITRVARSGARYDDANAYLVCWLSVATSSVEDWERYGEQARWHNWPAEDVRAVPHTEEGGR